MKVISVNTGLPRAYEWHGETVTTGIFKSPVGGVVAVRRLNLDGDRQADLTVHGGVDKAVYAYPTEHYSYWQEQLPGFDLPWGSFGENLSTEGLLESEVYIGDRFRIGSAVLVVTQPRLPCYKLGLRFGSDAMPKRFFRSERLGIYFSVEEEGKLEAGSDIERLSRDENRVSLIDLFQLYFGKRPERELFTRTLRLKTLPQSWKDGLIEKYGPQFRS